MKPSDNWTHESTIALEKQVQAYALKEGLWFGKRKTNTDWESALGDVIADLMHVADKHGIDWANVIRRADNHHTAERAFRCKGCGLRMDESKVECRSCGGTRIVSSI